MKPAHGASRLQASDLQNHAFLTRSLGKGSGEAPGVTADSSRQGSEFDAIALVVEHLQYLTIRLDRDAVGLLVGEKYADLTV